MRRQREPEEKNTRAKEAEFKLQREIEALKAMWLQSSNNKPQVVNDSDSVITDAYYILHDSQ